MKISNGIITEDGSFFTCGYMGHSILTKDLIELGYGFKEYNSYHEQPWFFITHHNMLHGHLMYAILYYNDLSIEANKFLKYLNLPILKTLGELMQNKDFEIYETEEKDLFFCNYFLILEKIEKDGTLF